MALVYCAQKNKRIFFIHRYNFQTRGIITEKLIRETIEKYNLQHHNFNIKICTGDYLGDTWHEKDKDILDNTTYSFCASDNNYTKCFPSWIYDSWQEIGVSNTTEYIKNIIDTKFKYNKIGWIGNTRMNISRKIFLEKFRKTSFTEAISQNDPTRHCQDKNRRFLPSFFGFLTLQGQVDRWKYLIDLNARGYSGRLIFLLSSPRIIFIQETKHKEWYWEFLKPWQHYIPVKHDFSDLRENFDKIESDNELQEYIKYNQKIFANKFLTKSAALWKIANILSSISNQSFSSVFDYDK